MQRSFKSRLEALERLEAVARTREPWQRLYYLPTDAYPRAIVQAFRAGDLRIADGRIAIDTNPHRQGWPCDWIADALNAFDGWGDVFLSAGEIAAARDLADRGWLAYRPTGVVMLPNQPPQWLIGIGHAQNRELYMTDRPRYFAVHETGRQVEAAARVASWRLGMPIDTLSALRTWLDAARPLTLSPAMVEAIEPIFVSALAASGLGLDPQTLSEYDDEEL